MVGLTPPPLMIGSAMTSKPIYFDSIDNCAYILGKAEHSARTSITPGCPFRVINGHTDKSTPCPLYLQLRKFGRRGQVSIWLSVYEYTS